MTCILVIDEPMIKNAIETLIGQTDNLTLVSSFGNTANASRFMSKHTVDLVFTSILIDEKKNYKFIEAIPQKTFVIFISESSSTRIGAYEPQTIFSSKSTLLQEAIDLARAYSKAEKNENSNIQSNYFVI